MTEFSERSAAPRPGFSLIEVITAMLAATLLMSALAASVVISTNLLETPPSDLQLARDRLIKDRLRSDLRYACTKDRTVSGKKHGDHASESRQTS